MNFVTASPRLLSCFLSSHLSDLFSLPPFHPFTHSGEPSFIASRVLFPTLISSFAVLHIPIIITVIIIFVLEGESNVSLPISFRVPLHRLPLLRLPLCRLLLLLRLCRRPLLRHRLHLPSALRPLHPLNRPPTGPPRKVYHDGNDTRVLTNIP